jgi:hypothetical protein
MPDDLAARMARKTARTKTKTEEPAFRSAPPAYAKRLSVDMTEEDHRALRLEAAEHGGTMVDVIRALIAQWRDDEELQATLRKRRLAS